MRVIVCGGRDYQNRSHVYAVLRDLRQRYGSLTIIEGGATGADRLAREWASHENQACVTVEADWKLHGRAAGPLRNRAMLEQNPALVVAFPGGRGTADMTKQALAAGVQVLAAVDGDIRMLLPMGIVDGQPGCPF